MNIQLIHDPASFESFINLLKKEKAFAFDFEFDKNRFRYGFTMCLMQVAIGIEGYIIDPLAAGIDVRRLFPLFEDPSVTKIGFELGEDIRLLKHMGCRAVNLQDLSVATKLLNYNQISLVNALQLILGEETSKQSQKSNWFKRPLTKAQIAYAAEDVVHLFDLRNKLLPLIDERGMRPWMDEENKAIENTHYEPEGIASYIKERDKDDMDEVQWQVFVGLLQFRQELARQSKRPPYQVMDKDFLIDLAKEKEALSNFFDSGKIMQSLRNEAFKEEIKLKRETLEADALKSGFIKGKAVREKQSREELRRIKDLKRETEEKVESYLRPIQAALKKDFGENAALYLLSSKLMKEIASGEAKDLKRYKRELITRYAAQLNIDLSAFGI